MATQIPSQSELYDIYINAAQAAAPVLTDTNEGSVLDASAGATSLIGEEIGKVIQQLFAKTFFRTAHGPEVTLGDDDLENLAVDHFGERFARPEASEASGVVTFSRPTSGAGNILIPIGTIVKTAPDANGNSQRYETLAAVTITGLSINASVSAIVAGLAGNVNSGTVTVIESTLLDPTIVVTNALAFVGGAAEQGDSEYQQTIRNLIETLRGATLAAIEATALTVAGVETATAVEREIVVREWSIANDAPVAGSVYFRIPEAILYIADANGTASGALIDAVVAAIEPVRAAGVEIQIKAAQAFTLNWMGSITLDSGGPNYASLVSDASPIEQTMRDYLQDLAIGSGFDRGVARNAILAIWGSPGTGDLTDFDTTSPVGNVAGDPITKIVPGSVEIS